MDTLFDYLFIVFFGGSVSLGNERYVDIVDYGFWSLRSVLPNPLISILLYQYSRYYSSVKGSEAKSGSVNGIIT